MQRLWHTGLVLVICCLSDATAQAQKSTAKKPAPPTLSFPPTLPRGERVVTDTSDAFLKPTETIAKDVLIAKTAPTVDFLYFPRQDYEGKPWSNWGDSLAINGKYYASIGDHYSQFDHGFPS